MIWFGTCPIDPSKKCCPCQFLCPGGVLLEKVPSQGTAVELWLATRTVDERGRTLAQYRIFNLTSLFSDFYLLLRHPFPIFGQHFWRCPLLFLGNIFGDNLFIEITCQLYLFTIKTVGSVLLLTTPPGTKLCLFYLLIGRKNSNFPPVKLIYQRYFLPNSG